MQHTKTWKMTPLVLAIASSLSLSAFAEESTEQASTAELSTSDESCLLCNVGGSVGVYYSSNLYDQDDYRLDRSLSWNGSLNYKLSENTRLYITSGGYKAYDNKTGIFANDTVVGMNYSGLFSFGETGKVGLGGQFTIPTSETSRDTRLYTAFRIDLPISFKALGVNFSVQPRLRKNFYEYETINGRVLTEWQGTLSMAASYPLHDSLTIGGSLLGGNGMSYKGARAREFTYGGSLFASYSINDNWLVALSVASSGRYYDAQQGNLGNVDLFDAEKASYTVGTSYSF